MSNFYVKYKWGKWEEATEIDGVEVLEILKQQETRITKLEAEIKGLHTTMMAAAVEIQEHWDAHCDEDGYGPANLMRRLEHGIDGGYGYSAKTFAQMDDRIVALKARIAKQIEVVRQARQALEREATVTPIGNHRRRNGSTRRRHLRRTGGIMTPERLEIVLSVLRKCGY